MAITYEDLYAMRMHETKNIRTGTDVMRVPGGWMYSHAIDDGSGTKNNSVAVFVPYNTEFTSSDTPKAV